MASSFLTSLWTGIFWCLAIDYAWARTIPYDDQTFSIPSINELFNDQNIIEFVEQEENLLAHEQFLSNGRQLEGLGAGQRCGNNNLCAEGYECARVNLVNRCVPKTCLEEGVAKQELYNLTRYEEYEASLFEEAGFTKEEFLTVARASGGGTAFAATDEFKRFMQALKANAGPLRAMQGVQRDCMPEQTVEDIQYIGFHLEFGFVADVTFQYLLVDKGSTTGVYTRVCGGLEAGAGIEIALLTGGACQATNISELEGLSCWGDGAASFIGHIGGAVGVGFTSALFQYDFTFGVGCGLGIGTRLCNGFAFFENCTI